MQGANPPESAAAPAHGDAVAFDPEKKMEDYEREIILKAIAFCGGNKSEAAKQLGILRLTLYKKIRSTPDIYEV